MKKMPNQVHYSAIKSRNEGFRIFYDTREQKAIIDALVAGGADKEKAENSLAKIEEIAGNLVSELEFKIPKKAVREQIKNTCEAFDKFLSELNKMDSEQHAIALELAYYRKTGKKLPLGKLKSGLVALGEVFQEIESGLSKPTKAKDNKPEFQRAMRDLRELWFCLTNAHPGKTATRDEAKRFAEPKPTRFGEFVAGVLDPLEIEQSPTLEALGSYSRKNFFGE